MISVIIPTYNRAQTIEKSINSVLAQTYKNIELIVVDDCSKDNTQNIVSSIEDDRLKYIKLEKNSGANYARNTGISEASGEYIAFQDSDDIWRKEKLELELKFMLESNYDVVFCSMMQHHGNGKEFRFPRIKKKMLGNLSERVLYGNIMSTQTILARKEVLNTERFDNSLERFQDWDLAIRLLNNYSVGFLDKVLVDVYVGEDSISKSSIKAVRSMLKLLNKYENLFKKKKINNYVRLYLLKYSLETKDNKVIKKVIDDNWKNCKNLITFSAKFLGAKNMSKLFFALKKVRS